MCGERPDRFGFGLDLGLGLGASELAGGEREFTPGRRYRAGRCVGPRVGAVCAGP
ncbi:hypothetical protein [Streptomyces sp. Da 82-17]|uniref:hypothetical protein n=1 Tax=Streptomyces sp. Da 82-17 TaxID=3377116 RepID=UPI0038D47222